MPNKFDVIVVGAGTMGASACWHLARRGVRVLGLDQFAIPHTFGAHHGHSRIVRMAYYEHPDYVPLLRRAYELWNELESTSGEQLLHLTGGLCMGERGAAVVEGAIRSAETHNLPHQPLSNAEIRRRWPVFQIPDNFTGLWEPQMGFVVPETVMCAHINGALAAGAELRGNCPAESWEATADGVTVSTPQGRFEAKHLILAGGAWSSQLLHGEGIDLKVTRQSWGWFAPEDPAPFQPDQFPCWFLGHKTDHGYYGFPMMPDNPGLKIALHELGQVTTPDQVNRNPIPADERDLRWALERFLPTANGPLLGIRTCLYTNSPDGHFILDHHPRHPKRVTIACGFSGHGFKFAPVIGQALADLATTNKTNLPINFLSLNRFNNQA